MFPSNSSRNSCSSPPGGWPQHGVGAEIAAAICEGPSFGFLDAPIMRVAGADVPIPYTKTLELNATPHTQIVLESLRKVLGR